MSEISREEMLAWLDHQIVFYRELGKRTKLQPAEKHEYAICDAIRALISEAPENRPKVSKEFVEKWTKKQWASVSPLEVNTLIEDMLREAGVEVSDAD